MTNHGREKRELREQSSPRQLYYLYINVKVCTCQLEVGIPSRAGKGEQMWSGGEAVMAGQRGLPVVGRTCFHSREASVCPTVRYKPFRQLSSLALGLWRREAPDWWLRPVIYNTSDSSSPLIKHAVGHERHICLF